MLINGNKGGSNASNNLNYFMGNRGVGMKPELNMRYSILPSRMTGDKRLKIAHYDVMVCLGCYASPKGLVYMTVQTMERHCPHVKRETINKAIKDLIKWEYVRKLESKYIKGQQSKWLTNRYQLLYEKDMPVPPYEELAKQVVSLDRVDDAFKHNVGAETNLSDNQGVSLQVATIVCEFLNTTVGTVSGSRPNYSPKEYVKLTGQYERDLEIASRDVVIDYVKDFLDKNKRNPNLAEVVTACYI